MNKAYITFILGVIFTSCGIFFAANDGNFYNKYNFNFVEYPYGNKIIVQDETFSNDITDIDINFNQKSVNYKKDSTLGENEIRIVVKQQEFINFFVQEVTITKDSTNIKIDSIEKQYEEEDLYSLYNFSNKSLSIIDKQLYFIRSNFYKKTFVVPTINSSVSKPEIIIYYDDSIDLNTIKEMINE